MRRDAGKADTEKQWRRGPADTESQGRRGPADTEREWRRGPADTERERRGPADTERQWRGRPGAGSSRPQSSFGGDRFGGDRFGGGDRASDSADWRGTGSRDGRAIRPRDEGRDFRSRVGHDATPFNWRRGENPRPGESLERSSDRDLFSNRNSNSSNHNRFDSMSSPRQESQDARFARNRDSESHPEESFSAPAPAPKVVAAPVETKPAQPLRTKRDVDLAPELAALNLLTAEKAKTPLEAAIDNLNSLIEAKDLASSFQRLDLNRAPISDATVVLGNSLIDNKFTAGQLMDAIEVTF